MFAAYIMAALALWGASATVAVQTYSNDNGQLAQTNPLLGDGSCLIAIYEPGWQRLGADERLSLILHETGHCLGLGHYGSCNYNASIMGCWNLGHLTDLDRATLSARRNPTHRAVLPMVGN